MKRMNLVVVFAALLVLVPALAMSASHKSAENGHDHGAISHDGHSDNKMDNGDHSGHKMDHGDHSGHKMEHDGHDSMSMKGGMIMLGEQSVDGVKANFHMKDVEKKMAEMGMSVTHHFMVALTDSVSGKELEDGIVAVKVTDPSGKEGDATKLMGMQGHFGVDVTLKDPGTYTFNVATKLEDGKTRKFTTSFTK